MLVNVRIFVQAASVTNTADTRVYSVSTICLLYITLELRHSAWVEQFSKAIRPILSVMHELRTTKSSVGG